MQFVENPDEPPDVDAEFLTWVPGHPPGANALNAVIAGHAYLIFATTACQRVLTGRPAVPRIEWLPGTNALNLVGFRSQPTAKFGSYLAGAGFTSAKVSIFSVGGTNSARPTTLTVGGFSGGFSTAPIEQGKRRTSLSAIRSRRSPGRSKSIRRARTGCFSPQTALISPCGSRTRTGRR